MLHTFQGTLYHFVKKSKKSSQPANLTKSHTNKHPQTIRKPHHTQITHKPSVNHIQTTHKKIPRKIHTFRGILYHFVVEKSHSVEKSKKVLPTRKVGKKNALGRSEPSKGIPFHIIQYILRNNPASGQSSNTVCILLISTPI